MGVHKVSSHSEWKTTVNTIDKEVEQFAQNFPKEVLSSSSFIVEEIIQGEEFAIDTYFDKNGTPVILNIFQHPFVSEDDVSDRAYISSGKVIKENLKTFEKIEKKTWQKVERCDRIAKLPFEAAGIGQDFLRKILKKDVDKGRTVWYNRKASTEARDLEN